MHKHLSPGHRDSQLLPFPQNGMVGTEPPGLTTLLAESRAETLQDQAASCGWELKAATGNAAGVLFATTYSMESNCPSRLALNMQCLAWQVVWC